MHQVFRCLAPSFARQRRNSNCAAERLITIFSPSSLAVAPDSLRIIGPSEARAGELLSYSCSTTNSNPAAAVHWTVGNETRPAERTNVVRSPSGGYITHSEITVSLGPADRSKMIVCNAVNTELNDAKSESKMLSVICK